MKRHDRRMFSFLVGGTVVVIAFCRLIVSRFVDPIVLEAGLVVLGIFGVGWFFGMATEQKAAMRIERARRARDERVEAELALFARRYAEWKRRRFR
jgi:hypothetical protein